MIYRVKEKWLLTGWTYIEADSREAAQAILENKDDNDDFDADRAEWRHEDTLWNTLKPVEDEGRHE